MAEILLNVDVPELESAVSFFERAFELRVGRRLRDGVVELLGERSRIFLLANPSGSVPFDGATSGRSYSRHWTPVHYDFVVDDLEAAIDRAVSAGATCEAAIETEAYGRIARLADPFGHGFCLLAFSSDGYDAIADDLRTPDDAPKKRLLVVAHAPSANTRRMLDALVRGARHPEAEGVAVRVVPPLLTRPEDVLAAHAIVLMTPENLGAMSGALKDFFDRCYEPCRERTDALPCALVVRAGHDGTGTVRGVRTILTGLRWKSVAEPLVCHGAFDDAFLPACEELGATMAVGLAAGVL